MLYALLRALAGIALRWYYGRIEVMGAERIPAHGPVLLVVNHPNALIDALVAAWVAPRRVLLTGKATLFTNPVAAWALRMIGVVPLRRISDDRTGIADPARNADAFSKIVEALAADGLVLIFPEGKSHDEPAMAPLRSGAARMALETQRAIGARALSIVPLGLVFERKETAGSRISAEVGDPIDVRDWVAREDAPRALTAEIDRRLRDVTLNHESHAAERWTNTVARRLVRLHATPRPMDAALPSLRDELAIARRLQQVAAQLQDDANGVRARARDLDRRLADLDVAMDREGIALEDIGMELQARVALRFALRELALLAVASPVAWWGEVNHWLPFHAAEWIGARGPDRVSRDQPAMRAIVSGALLVLGCYLAQTFVVASVTSVPTALGYLLSLPLAAEVNFALRARRREAQRRVRAWQLFQRDPSLHRALLGERDALRADVAQLEQELSVAAGRDLPGPSARPLAAHPSADP
ncbi:MAG: hypothetical protein JWO05_1837 [Gemmatimonadetes bacterium]|nr:hypothetical protein [Gemmatimonadota bacterium]